MLDKLRSLRIQDKIVLLVYSSMMVLIYVGNDWFKEPKVIKHDGNINWSLRALSYIHPPKSFIDEQILINWGILTFILLLYWIFFGIKQTDHQGVE